MTWTEFNGLIDGYDMVKHKSSLNSYSKFSVEQEQPISTDGWGVYLECIVSEDSFTALHVGGLTLDAAKNYCEGVKSLHDKL